MKRQKLPSFGGSEGGKFESVAVNPRNPDLPVFYVTEDRSGGALRRFIANGTGWQALHNEDGMIDFLHIVKKQLMSGHLIRVMVYCKCASKHPEL